MLRNCTFEGRTYFNGFSTTTVLFRERERERTEQTRRGGGLRRPLRGSRKPYFPGGFLIASLHLMSRVGIITSSDSDDENERRPRSWDSLPVGSLANSCRSWTLPWSRPPVCLTRCAGASAVERLLSVAWLAVLKPRASYIAPSPSGRWEEKICVRRREFSQPCYLILSFSPV